MQAKSVVITGAAGFIGSHLTERCLAQGWRVVGIDAFTEYYDPAQKRANCVEALTSPNYELVEGDLLDIDLDSVFDGASTVFHLAAQPGVRASWDVFSVYTRRNLDATQRVLEAARATGVDRTVLASSSSIYGDAEALPTEESTVPQPVSPYGVTKAACEYLAGVYWRNFGVATVCLRYFTVYGPRQRPDMAFNRLIGSALDGTAFCVFGDGNQSRDFTFVDDAVTGTIAAAEAGVPGFAYNIGGGSRRTMNDVFATLESIMGREVKRTYTDWQAGDARDTSADISLAGREFGYEPSVDFRTGLQAQLNWQRSWPPSVRCIA